MPVYNFDITRYFQVTDSVQVEADTEEQALEKTYENYDTLKSEIPQHVYEWVEFEDYIICPMGEEGAE